MIHVPQWHNANFENLYFFVLVSARIPSFTEKLIYNLKVTLKILKKKNCKIPILPQYEYPMPYRLQFFKK
jgi:hypothetical protein